MNRTEAKRILASWRPGVDDDDPAFAAALAFAKADPELAVWLEQERAVYAAIRGKLTEPGVPADLARKIIAERPITMPVRWSGRAVLQLAAAIAVLAGLATYWLWPGPRNDVEHYEAYLTQLVSNGYHMSLESDDSNRIRSFLASNQAPADYTLPQPLHRVTPLGCATLSWNGNPVSMLCFRDHPGRDVFLFVVDRNAIPNRPPNAEPQISQEDGFSTATWESGGRTYVLTVKGDPAVVRSYL